MLRSLVLSIVELRCLTLVFPVHRGLLSLVYLCTSDIFALINYASFIESFVHPLLDMRPALPEMEGARATPADPGRWRHRPAAAHCCCHLADGRRPAPEISVIDWQCA